MLISLYFFHKIGIEPMRFVSKHKLKRQTELEIIFKTCCRHEIYTDNAYLMKSFILYLVTEQFYLHINILEGEDSNIWPPKLIFLI